MLNVYADAVPGESLAGFSLGENLSDLIDVVDTVIDGSETKWTAGLAKNSSGVLLYKFKEGGGVMYFARPCLELHFNDKGILCAAIAGSGYQGEIYRSVNIGSELSKIDHLLYLDDANDVHYLCDEDENILPGIYFIAEGESVDEDPNQVITQVCIYNENL